MYRFERQQYSELLLSQKDVSPCDVYGAEHLLRLFVQMPSIIAHTSMDGDSVSILRDHFLKFLLFIEKDKETYFGDVYEDATPQYIENNMN